MSTTNKNINELRSINEFIKYLGHDPSLLTLVNEPKNNGKTPDFYIKELETLVELKAIYELSDNIESARWSKIVNRLKSEIKSDMRYLKLDGLFSIDTPRNIKIPREKLNKCSEKLLDSIFKNESNVDIFGYNFKITRFESEIGDITFSGFGEVRSINSAEIIYTNIHKQVLSANDQLAYSGMGVKRRILLLSNKFYIGSVEDVIKALSKMYDELLACPNIEEIYIQIGNEQSENWHHELIYTRDFLLSFEGLNISPKVATHISLFEKWFWAFEDMPNKVNQVTNGLHNILDKNNPWDVFMDSGKRSSMVKFGEKLLKNGDLINTRWIIDKFINDPDPPIKYSDPEKEKHNLHQLILKGEDVSSITTVQGHLAWLVKELCQNSSKNDIHNLVYSFNLAKNKLSHKDQNLYVILEWLFVLIDIANRRIWLANKAPDTYEEFKLLLLGEDGLITKYSKFKVIARNLVNIFYFFKDLTTEESNDVLSKLIFAPEYDAILVYFAFFRERHYAKGSEAGDIFVKYSKRLFNFSPIPARQKISQILRDDAYQQIRGSIAWQFWKIIKDDTKEFNNLSEYISEMFNCPYERNLYTNLEMIIEETYGKPFDTNNLSHKWLIKYLENVSIKSAESKELWLSLDEVFVQVAKSHPENLMQIINSLYIIWKNYGYIGDMINFFGLYKNVEDLTLKNIIKKRSEVIYSEMKKNNPKLWDISFE